MFVVGVSPHPPTGLERGISGLGCQNEKKVWSQTLFASLLCPQTTPTHRLGCPRYILAIMYQHSGAHHKVLYMLKTALQIGVNSVLQWCEYDISNKAPAHQWRLVMSTGRLRRLDA